MSSTGAVHPGHGSNHDLGGADWVDPTNIEDGTTSHSYMECAKDDGQNDGLRGDTFSFSIPVGVEISGIIAKIKARDYDNGGDTSWVDIRLMYNSAKVGTNYAPSGAIASNYTWYTIGGATDLWGRTWTAAEINHNTFGILIDVSSETDARRINVEQVTLEIYYGGGTTMLHLGAF